MRRRVPLDKVTGIGPEFMAGRTCAAFVVIACLAVAPVRGHHLITEVYDVAQTTTITGRVAGVVLKNPHTFVHLSVVSGEGQTRTWAVELEGATKLRQLGIDSDTFDIGDQLTVCGNPGRDASQYRLLMLELRRARDRFTVSRRVAESEATCP